MFNYEQIAGRMKRLKDEPQYYYTIGVDDVGEIKSYCLMRNKVGGPSEIILSKTFDETDFSKGFPTDFEIEVENLAEYFDATIYKETI